jgi:hypothetical protein
VPTLQELKKIVAFCRKQGITHLEMGEIKFDLTLIPRKPQPSDIIEEKQSAGPTEEELLFWSAPQ